MTATALSALVDRARFLLLDFDGPVCAVFANHPAPTIAAELRRLLVDQGVPLPEHIRAEADPLAVLRFTATLGKRQLVHRVDDALRSAELTAARTAEPTPHAREVIVAAQHSGRRVAIVSNNSAEAVRAYLLAHRLDGYLHPIIGRAYADPAQMKPNPAPVLAAVAELHADPGTCLMIGDSASDITAAHTARVPAIGYANKPGKATHLDTADAVITCMADLVTVLAPDGP
ncbi:HAD-IA family hydrolase [Solwaraspora sp. WMMD1047]|uniref:HAD family hydrolase n=1 Tax=Solwaraspora sp. WMMD1047 TaxID=3016102 RepID=UPI00241704B6|nr:HAD-IA family hydrolase [Solwaraspora sp. WMMD1047]MDG4828394.1 HAD-IA family hydrolase [Solwaraspora sp. WMMD1047]